MTENGNKNLRNIVLNMLAETLDKGVFSHVVVNETFAANELQREERAFISRLYLGVLERLIFIDHCINKVSRTNTSAMKSVILNILRLSVYQLLFMDAVPDHAAINEAGALARKRGFSQLVPFVNGVLRGIQRGRDEGLFNDLPVNVRLSVPKWIYEMTVKAYGEEKAVSFFEGSLQADKKVTVRLNGTGNIKKEQIAEKIRREGCSLISADDEKNCWYLEGFSSLTGLKAYKEGLFSVQDLSSVKAALAGCRELAKDGNKKPLIIDVCAAPGGKSIVAAQEFPEGIVMSRDISEEKVSLIRENKKRLGLGNIFPQVWDATVFDSEYEGKADMVIADLPCSGLGVIAGKPDIKFRIRQKDIQSLILLQRNILKAVYRYVKPGGLLLYSTCTIDPGENTENAGWICQNLPFDMVTEQQILEGSDGFYISVFRRKQS